jgi:release factor glutamine methyltransferase
VRVDEALSRATGILPVRRGLPDPHREALFLLAAASGLEEIQLRIHPEQGLPPEVEEQFFRWIERRSAGEPAEHIVGHCSFWGRTFRVSPEVLIPRPETELMIQAVLSFDLPPNARVADIGTGSGCLAVTLAVERPGWDITATDRSPAALAIARTNAAAHDASILWILTDLAGSCGTPFDLIVANLPYVPTGWLKDLGPEIEREPRSALDGGEDGLDLIRRLIEDLPQILNPGGLCLLELAEDQADTVEDLGLKQRLVPRGRLRDVGGCDRVVILGRA